MPTFLLKVRKILPVEAVSVDAPTRDKAIYQVVQAAADNNETVEVMGSEELPPTGPTGTVGAAGVTGTTGSYGPTAR
jgi:hypothetical protein